MKSFKNICSGGFESSVLAFLVLMALALFYVVHSGTALAERDGAILAYEPYERFFFESISDDVPKAAIDYLRSSNNDWNSSDELRAYYGAELARLEQDHVTEAVAADGEWGSLLVGAGRSQPSLKSPTLLRPGYYAVPRLCHGFIVFEFVDKMDAEQTLYRATITPLAAVTALNK